MDKASTDTTAEPALGPRTLTAEGGSLTATIAGDMFDTPTELSYRLSLRVTVDDRPGELILTGLPLPGRSWRALANAAVTFGADATETRDGQVVRVRGVGAILLDSEQLDVRASRLELGDVRDPVGTTPLTLEAAVAWPVPDTSRRIDVPVTLQTEIELGDVTVRGDTTGTPPSREEAMQMAADFLDLDDYERGERGRFVTLRPR